MAYISRSKNEVFFPSFQVRLKIEKDLHKKLGNEVLKRPDYLKNAKDLLLLDHRTSLLFMYARSSFIQLYN